MTESTSILSADLATGACALLIFPCASLRVAYFKLLSPVDGDFRAVVFPGLHPTGFVWMLLTVPLVLLNMVWLSVPLSLVGARFPEIEKLVNFLLAPIIWYSDQVSVGNLRDVLMRLNALFHFIEAVRAPLLGEHVVSPT